MLHRSAGLKENVPRKGEGTVRRCGLVGVGVAVLEEVDFEVSSARFIHNVAHRSPLVACESRCRNS